MDIINNTEKSSTSEVYSNKILETKQLLDEIHSELRGLKNDTDINKINEITSKIEELNNNSLEYSNLHQREIKILGEILKDFKGETGRELDRQGIIDFKYNFKEFSEKIKQKIEKIKDSDISIIYLDKLISKLYKYNTSKELESIKREIFTEFKNIFDNIFKNNINTKIILIDMQLSNEYYKLIYNLQKKYNSDIKVIIGTDNSYNTDSDKKRFNKYNLYYGSVDVDLKSNLGELSIDVIKSVLYKHDHKEHKGIIDDIITINKNNLNVGDSINLLLNPRNILKFTYGEKEVNKNGKIYNSKDYKGSNHNFNDITVPFGGKINKSTDTKIIMFGDTSSDGKGPKDQFIDSYNGNLVSGTEIIANSIVDNDMNK